MKRDSVAPRALLALFLAALVVRLLFAIGMRGLHDWPDDDNRLYQAAATGLLHGEDLPMRWPPLLPLLGAGFMLLFGESILVPKLLVLFAGALVAPLTALLAARWAGARAGLFAGALACIDGYLVAHSATAMTEMLHSALLLGGLVALPDAELPESPGRRRGLVLAGLLLGLAALARPTGLPLVAAIAAGLMMDAAWRAGWKRGLVSACTVVAAALVVVAPWGLRNLAHSGHLVLATTGAGSTLLGSNCAQVLVLDEAWLSAERCGVLSGAELASLATEDEVQRDGVLLRAALRDLRAHPERWGALLLHKASGFWGGGSEGRHAGPVSKLCRLGLLLLLPFAIAGLLLLLGRWRQGHAVTPLLESLLVLCAVFALSMVFWGGSRMRVPVEPLLLAFAAVALAGWTSRGRRS